MAESGVADVPQPKAPTDAATDAICGLPFQPALDWISFEEPAPLLSKSWSNGSARVPDNPNWASAGPDARSSTVFAVEPPMTNPAIKPLVPVPTTERADRLTSREDAFENELTGVAS